MSKMPDWFGPALLNAQKEDRWNATLKKLLPWERATMKAMRWLDERGLLPKRFGGGVFLKRYVDTFDSR